MAEPQEPYEPQVFGAADEPAAGSPDAVDGSGPQPAAEPVAVDGGDLRGAVRTRIGQAIMLHRAGDCEEARNRLALLWSQTVDGGDLFDLCTIAHFMAGAQQDPADALEWDRRALAAADAVAVDEASWDAHALALCSLYPSLHLSLAADHARLGEERAARRELARARGAVDALTDDAYAEGMRARIVALESRLGAG